MVRAWSAIERVMPGESTRWRRWKICSRGGYSNFSTPFIKPMLPSWIKSRNDWPRFVYFWRRKQRGASWPRHVRLGFPEPRSAAALNSLNVLKNPRAASATNVRASGFWRARPRSSSGVRRSCAALRVPGCAASWPGTSHGCCRHNDHSSTTFCL